MRSIGKSFETNAVIRRGNPLHSKAHKLVKAAYEYWLEYNQQFGSAAVIFVESDSGHFVCFTRGEYKREMMAVVDNISGHPVMEHPFAKD